MKLGVLIDRLNIGGVEKSAIMEVKEMCKHDVDVELLVLSSNSIVENAYASLLKDIKVVYLDTRFPRFLRLRIKIPGFSFFSLFHLMYPLILPFYVRKKEWSHIISHSSYTTLSALSLRFFRKIPYSVFYWDPVYYIINRVYTSKFPRVVLFFFLGLAKVLDFVLAFFARKVFLGSPAHVSYFSRPLLVNKIEVIPPGVVFSSNDEVSKKDYVLTLTAWKSGKHPEYLLDILHHSGDVKIKIAGPWLDSALKEAFISEINSLGFGDRVEFLGFVSEDSFPSLFSEALVNLTLNLEKGFGMPVIEAAAHGTVSIIPRGSGVCFFLNDRESAFFVEEGDGKKIASIIEELRNDKSLSLTMGLSARQALKNTCTWERHVSDMLTALTA